MKNPNLSPLALALSLVALAISIYSLQLSGGLSFINLEKELVEEEKKPEGKEIAVSDDFKEQVYAVIDDYVAEMQAEEAAAQVPQPTGPVDVSLDDDAMKGDEDAPVTIVEFTDYQCPYCNKFFVDSYSQIVKNYIDTGKVKYVVRDFPLPFHKEALPSANAAECLKDQAGDEAYFAYHDLLFQNQATLSSDNYKKWAAEFEVDQAEFDSCVDELKFKDEIEADMAEGQSYGVQGTPAFFINGMSLSGAMPYATFEQMIQEALQE